MNWKIAGAPLILVVTGGREIAQGGDVTAVPSSPPQQVLANEAYRLVVRCAKDAVVVSLDDRQMGFCLAQGTYLYRGFQHAAASSRRSVAASTVLSAEVVGDRLTIHGKRPG